MFELNRETALVAGAGLAVIVVGGLCYMAFSDDDKKGKGKKLANLTVEGADKITQQRIKAALKDQKSRMKAAKAEKKAAKQLELEEAAA